MDLSMPVLALCTQHALWLLCKLKAMLDYKLRPKFNGII